MKFFEDAVLQARKRGHLVCGDHYLCRRTPEATVLILCDGVGSGVYANVAAVTCASRLYALLEEGCSLRAACSMVAESMHRARTGGNPVCGLCGRAPFSRAGSTRPTHTKTRAPSISNRAWPRPANSAS